MSTSLQAELRKLPSVDQLLRSPALQQLREEHPQPLLTEAARAALELVRAEIRNGQPCPVLEEICAVAAAQLSSMLRPSLRPVINATGVIIHTNLGRAPLSRAARAAMDDAARGYSNLEYDLETGKRGSRYDHAVRLLRELTGAEDALVVNNNAAAVFLCLLAFAAGRNVLISRGQLVEIGGGFRIPDVLRASGARLVEVGTTNRTHRHDYEAAIDEETAALLRVHSSNFKQVGFTADVPLAEMVEIAHVHRQNRYDSLLVIDDLGSGTLLETEPFGLAAEPTVQASVAADADLITFSGDKLLGGPQAGLIVGRAQLLQQLRKHPLARALRVDKTTLAGLQATLLHYRRGEALQEVPVWRMISTPVAELEQRAHRWVERFQGKGLVAAAVSSQSTVGGGSLPGETLPTSAAALHIAAPAEATAALRRAEPPVIARIEDDHVLLDPRTVLPEDDELLQAQVINQLAQRTSHG